MNRILPSRRIRVASKRIAAATAAVVGAALLTYPGLATAETTGTDCAALGENPMADGMVAALESAKACGTEVRIAAMSGPFETVYATPRGQLHLVQTVAPAQDYQDRGQADPTLVESEGTLAPASSPIEFTFSGSDTAAPLMSTKAGNFDWKGDQTVPVVSGAAAVYDDLAEGVDLTIDAGVAASDLRFTIADADAWKTVAANLTATAAVYDNTLYAPHARTTPLDPATWEESTPFTVRDADGATYQATLTDGAENAISLALDQAVLDSAAYPLTLTATWTYHLFGVAEWGAVTSASPELAVFGGEAGLDQPYFEAAGQSANAVVGGYCDALADPECAEESQSVLYWNFWQSRLGPLTPDTDFTFSYPRVSATFSVEAADGAACVAPDLRFSEIYRPSTRWSNRPDLRATPAATGRCEGGTAVYDLSGPTYLTSGVLNTLAMNDSPETARFKGGSARLDSYYNIGTAFSVTMPTCASTAAAPKLQTSTSLGYGGFSAEFWRPDLVDPGLTWTATIRNSGTGQVLLATEPAAVADGTRPASTLTGLADGRYEIAHQFASADGTYTRSSTCYYLIDSAAPDLIDVEVPKGPYYQGDTITVKVTVADEGYPDGVNELTVTCSAAFSCSPIRKTLTTGTTASFEVPLYEDTTNLSIWAKDKAGNSSETERFALRLTEPSSDFNIDGNQDLVTVRKSDEALMFHAGKGDGTFKTAVKLASGWGGMDVVMAGDLTGDRFPDLLARDSKTGTMYTYPGDGLGGFKARITVGTGWNGLGAFTSATDFDGDGKVDVLAVAEASATLYLYPGKGNGTFGTRKAVETGWLEDNEGWDNLVTIGDVDGDTHLDLLARDGIFGDYLVFYTDGHGGIEQTRHLNAALLVDSDDGARYSQVVGGGDYTGDDWTDIYAVDSRTGELVLRSYDQNLFEIITDRVVATGWNTSRLPIASADQDYDYWGDGLNDILARRSSDGILYQYQGNGTGGFKSSGWFGDDFKNLDLIETGGDLNGDSLPDVIGRVGSTGSLYFFPGTGQGSYDYDARIRIGTGWNSMSAIVSGHDFNGDGKVDIAAREKSTGYLWLYPGKGNGYVGTRVKIGTGWNAMREITAAGDLDHDGHADVLAIRSSDNCMYFYGGRADGTLKPGVKTSCNWVGYDMVASVGDFNSDGHGDWTARRKSDGALFLYRGNAAGGYASRVQIGTGWNSMNIIA
jgi:hypothetical protein